MNTGPVTYKEAEEQANALGVNTDTISIERLKVGMNVELEHGTRSSFTDITEGTNNREILAKIALAHFVENPGSSVFPDYYQFLEQAEERSRHYWDSWNEAGLVAPKVFRQEAIIPGAIPKPAPSFAFSRKQ